MNIAHMLIRRARLAMQEFGPYMALAAAARRQSHCVGGMGTIAIGRSPRYAHERERGVNLRDTSRVVARDLGNRMREHARPAARRDAARADSLAAEQTLADAPLREDAWPGRDWWTALGDPQLDQLIREGLRDSPTLKVAAARTRAALAEAGVSEAARAPQASLSADATRERLSDNGIFPPPFAGSTTT